MTSSKFRFIRESLPYLKLIRDNQYCHDIEFVKNETIFECHFVFKPFNTGPIKVRLVLIHNGFVFNVVMSFFDPMRSNGSELIDDYFHGYKFEKIITFDDFKNHIEKVHDWAIDIMVKGQKPEHVMGIIKTYIPESFISGEELERYVKSRAGLKKYNL